MLFVILACVFYIPCGEKVFAKSPELAVHFINVGEGDSTLLTCDGEAMIVDFGIGENKENLLDYLKSQGVEKLKYAVGTHPHGDHMGAMSHIIENIPIDKIMLTKHESDEPFYLRTKRDIKKHHIPVIHPKAGKKFKLGKAKIKVLAPLKKKYKSDNDYSLVLKVVYKKISFLLTGDAEGVSEHEMLKKYKHGLRSTILKVGHHGSTTSSTKKFIKAVNPGVAIISVGPNKFGHPHDKILKRYEKLGIKVKRTDVDGTIVAKTNGKKVYWEYKK